MYLLALFIVMVVGAELETRYQAYEVSAEVYFQTRCEAEKFQEERHALNDTSNEAEQELQNYLQGLENSMNKKLFRWWPHYYTVTDKREVVYEDDELVWTKMTIVATYYNFISFSPETLPVPHAKLCCFLLRQPHVTRAVLFPEFQKLISEHIQQKLSA